MSGPSKLPNNLTMSATVFMSSLLPVIEASLRRLRMTSSSPSALRDACAQEQSRLNRIEFHLPPTYVEEHDGYSVCAQSVQLLLRCEPSKLDSYVPVYTGGDGNCLFRAISRSLYNFEDAHLALRWLATVEVGMHPELYDVKSSTCHELLREPLIVCPSYDKVFSELATSGADSCVIGLIAVCSALGITCHSYYPPGLCDVSPPLTTTLSGRYSCGSRSIAIMWTTTDDVSDTGDVRINHFVPLFHRRSTPEQMTTSAEQSLNEVADATVAPDHRDDVTVCDENQSQDNVDGQRQRKRKRHRRHATRPRSCERHPSEFVADADVTPEDANVDIDNVFDDDQPRDNVDGQRQRKRKRHRRHATRPRSCERHPTEFVADADVAPEDANVDIDNVCDEDQPRDNVDLDNVDDAAGESVQTGDNDVSRFSENVDLESIGLFDAIHLNSSDTNSQVGGPNRFDSLVNIDFTTKSGPCNVRCHLDH